MKPKQYIPIVVMLVSILSLFAGCSGKEPPAAVEPEPIPFPEGTRLTGLYMTHQGMAREPYYILKETENGICVKITDTPPEISQMDSGVPIEEMGEHWQYLGFTDTVLEFENAKLAYLQDASALERLTDAIVQSGALGWDGYEEHRSIKGVEDAGDTYFLFLLLSDGTSVKMHGYNACPAGFSDLLGQVMDIFYEITEDAADQ